MEANIGVAWKANHSTCLTATITRDSRGQVIDGITQIRICSSPLNGEAVALMVFVSLAKFRRVKSIIFESDSQVLIRAINDNLDGEREDHEGP